MADEQYNCLANNLQLQSIHNSDVSDVEVFQKRKTLKIPYSRYHYFRISCTLRKNTPQFENNNGTYERKRLMLSFGGRIYYTSPYTYTGWVSREPRASCYARTVILQLQLQCCNCYSHCVIVICLATLALWNCICYSNCCSPH